MENKLTKLTVSFHVKDDLTSERAAEYKQVIVDALGSLSTRCKHTQEIVDKLLNDCNR